MLRATEMRQCRTNDGWIDIRKQINMRHRHLPIVLENRATGDFSRSMYIRLQFCHHHYLRRMVFYYNISCSKLKTSNNPLPRPDYNRNLRMGEINATFSVGRYLAPSQKVLFKKTEYVIDTRGASPRRADARLWLRACP